MFGVRCASGLVGLTPSGKGMQLRTKQGQSLKSNTKEFRVYPEGSAEALQDFRQRCGVIEFII